MTTRFGPIGETWYISTDGGLYHSQDTLHTVLNLSLQGLRVSQYYSTLTSAADPDHVAAGSQDQGYQWAGSPPSSIMALICSAIAQASSSRPMRASTRLRPCSSRPSHRAFWSSGSWLPGTPL